MCKLLQYRNQLSPEEKDLLKELNNIKDSKNKKSRVKEIEDILNKRKIELKKNYIQKTKTSPNIVVNFKL